MLQYHIAVCDDERFAADAIASAAERELSRRGAGVDIEVYTALEELAKRMDSVGFDLVLLDIEMPGGAMMNRAKIMPLIENGVIDERVIDEKVQHILQSLLAFGFFDRPQKDESIIERNPYSDSVALEVARGGIVMLKNDGILPLEKGKVLVCGPNANTIVTGGGSGVVYPFESCSVAEGMRNMGRKYRSLYDTSGWETDLSMFYADNDCTIPGEFA